MRKYRNCNNNNELDLLDYFDFETGLWDHRGLLSDINIVRKRQHKSYTDCLSDNSYDDNYDDYSDDCSEREYPDSYSSEDEFSKDTSFEHINKDEVTIKQTLFQYIMSFFF